MQGKHPPIYNKPLEFCRNFQPVLLLLQLRSAWHWYCGIVEIVIHLPGINVCQAPGLALSQALQGWAWPAWWDMSDILEMNVGESNYKHCLTHAGFLLVSENGFDFPAIDGDAAGLLFLWHWGTSAKVTQIGWLQSNLIKERSIGISECVLCRFVCVHCVWTLWEWLVVLQPPVCTWFLTATAWWWTNSSPSPCLVPFNVSTHVQFVESEEQ